MDENNTRRNFTGSELAEGLRRQMAIEAEKAKERQQATQFGSDGGANIGTTAGKSRDKAAEQFGISGEQARKTLYVADNADMLDPADFADWRGWHQSVGPAYGPSRALGPKSTHRGKFASPRDARNSRGVCVWTGILCTDGSAHALDRGENDRNPPIWYAGRFAPNRGIGAIIAKSGKPCKQADADHAANAGIGS